MLFSFLIWYSVFYSKHTIEYSIWQTFLKKTLCMLIIFPRKERKTKWVKKIAMSVSLSDMYKTVMILNISYLYVNI